MKIPTPANLVTLFAGNGFPMPITPHVVLLRNKAGKVDSFDDMLLFVHGTGTIALACRCTTDPGKGPRQNPKNAGGCAVWAVSQVVFGLGFGLHKGSYECLVPTKPIPVLRYSSLEDATGTPSTSSTTQIHRASATKESTVVAGWSEGCSVVANPADFAGLMSLAHGSGQTRFTVTLCEWA